MYHIQLTNTIVSTRIASSPIPTIANTHNLVITVTVVCFHVYKASLPIYHGFRAYIYIYIYIYNSLVAFIYIPSLQVRLSCPVDR